MFSKGHLEISACLLRIQVRRLSSFYLVCFEFFNHVFTECGLRGYVLRDISPIIRKSLMVLQVVLWRVDRRIEKQVLCRIFTASLIIYLVDLHFFFLDCDLADLYGQSAFSIVG